MSTGLPVPDGGDSNPEVKLYRYDFVVIDAKSGFQTERVGRILEVLNGRRVRVQLYTSDGPTPETKEVDTQYVSLHPEGRLSVVDGGN